MVSRKPYTKRADLPAKEIVTRYQAGESPKRIADAYGTSDNTVRRLLQQQGVQLRTSRQAAKATGEQSDPEREALHGEIVELYGEGASTVSLSKRYGLAPSAVRSILLRNGVTLRSRSEAAHSRQPSLPPGPASALPSERIASEYRNGRTVASLATSYGVNNATIMGLLRRQGEEIRTRQSLPAQEVIERYQGGDSLATLAQHYGVSVKTIHRLMEEHGVERRPATTPPGISRVVKPDTETEIVRRHRAGESLRSIAATLGISRTSVKKVLNRQDAERGRDD